MDKKGVSQIVTVILIILLVLAAIVIVWQVVSNIVESGAKTVAEKAQCFEANLDFVEDSVACNVSVIGSEVSGTVSRGGDNIGSMKMKIVVGGTVSAAIDAPEALGTQTVTGTDTGLVVDSPVVVKVAPVVGDDLDVTCDPTDEVTVTCTD